MSVAPKSGDPKAGMTYNIILAPQAVRDLRALKTQLRSGVRVAIERHLRNEPTKVSKSRIKRLRGLSRPQYRLRVDEIRVFYDVSGDCVEVLAIIPKSGVDAWLRQAGEAE